MSNNRQPIAEHLSNLFRSGHNLTNISNYTHFYSFLGIRSKDRKAFEMVPLGGKGKLLVKTAWKYSVGSSPMAFV